MRQTHVQGVDAHLRLCAARRHAATSKQSGGPRGLRTAKRLLHAGSARTASLKVVGPGELCGNKSVQLCVGENIFWYAAVGLISHETKHDQLFQLLSVICEIL